MVQNLTHRFKNESTRVIHVMKMAYGMLAFRGQGIKYKSWDLTLHLHKTLVRSFLEYLLYVVQIVTCWLELERVQRSFTWLLPELKNFSYGEKLENLVSFSLECKRLKKNDLTEVYNSR